MASGRERDRYTGRTGAGRSIWLHSRGIESRKSSTVHSYRHVCYASGSRPFCRWSRRMHRRGWHGTPAGVPPELDIPGSNPVVVVRAQNRPVLARPNTTGNFEHRVPSANAALRHALMRGIGVFRRLPRLLRLLRLLRVFP